MSHLKNQSRLKQLELISNVASDMSKGDTIRIVLGKVFHLYMQAQCYHWNVEGPQFRSLHEMFETQYQTLLQHMDSVAERLRVLGLKAPETAIELIALSNGPEQTKASSAGEMLSSQCIELLRLNEVLKSGIQASTDIGDEGTVGVFTELLEWSEKEHWMMSVSKE